MIPLALLFLTVVVLALPGLSQSSGGKSSPSATATGGVASESGGYTVNLPKPECDGDELQKPSRKLVAVSGNGNGSILVENTGNANLSIVIEGRNPMRVPLARKDGFRVFVGPGDRVYAENADCGKSGRVSVGQ
ncbi:MAG TPA: hypothetical protein ENJ09_05720 [Planctomycetes bacterium]|nr:hypothetical protein [Planctomycetota bacterium]